MVGNKAQYMPAVDYTNLCALYTSFCNETKVDKCFYICVKLMQNDYVPNASDIGYKYIRY